MLNRFIKFMLALLVLTIVIPGCTSPIHEAVKQGDIALVRSLLDEGADVNAKGFLFYGEVDTPLHVAVDEDNYKIAELLISRGANVNARDDNWGWMPLHSARSKEMAELLIAQGARVNAITLETRPHPTSVVPVQTARYARMHTTPLQHALGPNGREIAEVLLNNGAYVNFTDSLGCTPLHYAARYGSYELIELLLARGANVNSRDIYGRTPLDYVRKMITDKAKKNIELLMRHGAK